MRRKVLTAMVLLLGLLPTAQMAWNWRSMSHLGMYSDDSIYFATARSIAVGDGYRIESLPGEPAQTKYPPLFPLLLSIVWKLNPDFPSNLPIATLLCWLMLPLFVAGAWRLFGLWQFDGWRRILLCSWLALSPIVAVFSMSMMSELMLCALLVFTVDLAERARDWRLALAAGAVAALACLARSAALPFLVSAPIVFLWRRQWRCALAFFAAMAPAVAAWQIWQRAHVSAGEDLTTLFYTKYAAFYFANLDWSQLPARVLFNFTTMVNGIGKLILFSEQESLFHMTVFRLATLMAVVGVVRLTRRTGALHFPAYALIYATLLLFWHYPPDARFMLPLIPLLLAGFLEMYLHLVNLVRTGLRKPLMADKTVAAIFGLLLLLIPLVAVRQTWHGFEWFVPELVGAERRVLAENLPAYQWIREHTPADAQFYADDGALLFLYTGRRATNVALPTWPMYQDDTVAIAEYLDGFPEMVTRHRLDYALVTPSDFRLQAPTIAQPIWRQVVERGSLFQEAHRAGNVMVFRLQSATAD